MRAIGHNNVLITHAGKTIRGEICFASANSLTLVLVFEGPLGNYTSMMPALWTEEGYVDPLQGMPVNIRQLGETNQAA